MHYEGEITEDHTVGDTDGRWLGVNGDEDASVFYERRLSDIDIIVAASGSKGFV